MIPRPRVARWSRSPEHRRKISEAMRRLGIRPLVGRLWEPWETALLGTVGDEEVRRRTGRTLTAIRAMRARLRIPTFTTSGRRKGPPMQPSAARRAGVPSRVRKAPSPPNPCPAADGRLAGEAQSPQRGKAPVAGLEEA
jgi:hypothetical protein